MTTDLHILATRCMMGKATPDLGYIQEPEMKGDTRAPGLGPLPGNFTKPPDEVLQTG